MDYQCYVGYSAIDVKPGDSEKDDGDPFCLELLCEMIKNTADQIEHVEMVTEETES